MHTAFDANSADAERVAHWLGTALDSYLIDDIGRWAFQPLQAHIGQRDDLAEDLRSIYASLTARAQARWRKAIRDLLATRGRDASRRTSTNVLVDFGVLIRAAEVLDVLPGLLAGEQGTVMLNRAVRAATALAAETEASRNCLERIRTSSAFKTDYAGLVLLALCRADPDRWLGHVQDLAVPMHRLARQLPDGSTALRFYATNILDIITLSRVTYSALSHLLAAKEPCWLLTEWFHGDRSLLRLKPETATTSRLVLRADESISNAIDGIFDTATMRDWVKTSWPIAIAWCSLPNGKRWVAVHSHGELRELATVRSPEEIRQRIAALRPLSTAGQHIEDWPLGEPTAGIAFPNFPPTAPRFVGEKDLLAYWGSVSNQWTARANYIKPYRQEMQAHLRRKAMKDRAAFSAAASSLALVHQPVPAPTAVSTN